MKHNVPPKIVEALEEVFTFIHGSVYLEETPVRTQVKMIERWLKGDISDEEFLQLASDEAQRLALRS
jgi:hypothetical protein